MPNMCSAERLSLIASICSRRASIPKVNRLNAYVPPSIDDEREEVALALTHNDDQEIADHEVEDGSPLISPDLARALKVEKPSHDRADDLLFTSAERKQIEEDKWRNRRRFALWVIPQSISDLLPTR
jgi:hypothetical protein